MLWTIAVVLAVLWLLGLVSSYTLGGFIHILLVLAIIVVLINVIQGEANLNQALIKDKNSDNLFVLAASQTRDKDALTLDGVGKVLEGTTSYLELLRVIV